MDARYATGDDNRDELTERDTEDPDYEDAIEVECEPVWTDYDEQCFREDEQDARRVR